MDLKIKVSAIIPFNYKDKNQCKILYSLIRNILTLKVTSFRGRIIEIRRIDDEIVINSVFDDNLLYHNYLLNEEGECVICQ